MRAVFVLLVSLLIESVVLAKGGGPASPKLLEAMAQLGGQLGLGGKQVSAEGTYLSPLPPHAT